ncbi:Ferrous iron transport protein B [Candidatus Desulfarcum epimagneticum]|uniref:Ferrous iron transport protein B n=1 Tax=uncultured Desulfobacteraceae bacterium TaxID=218296 RepID=A0A484HHC5_9BACT|nr:Ferrous iron transport protein B [uncultured Desulfobacteraceae bacterium]
MPHPIIALAGNPNAGKTTLFNALTGSRQRVGNYPGITVERKQGEFVSRHGVLDVTDLPGTYSLTAYSLEEVVARDFLVNEKPDMVINIVDASNLERNLYLSIQFLEMGAPVTLALNMMDMAESYGIEIDVKKLSKLLGIAVVPTVARTGRGKNALIDAAVKSMETPKPAPLDISYGNDIDGALDEMEAVIEQDGFLTETYPARWIALKYLENDEQILDLGRKKSPALSRRLEGLVEKVSAHLKNTFDAYPEALIADQRYGYINSLIKQGVVKHTLDQNRLQPSDKIDQFLTNRFLGPIIMAGVVMGLYHFTFSYSEIPVAWLESFFAWLGGLGEAYLPEGHLKSLLISGVINGVGGVMGFMPLIVFMFFGISLLEDSGYLARVSYMMDRVFRYFGLHGASVMAFVTSGGIAGGCAVPGVMAARTLKSRRERLATLLTVPFMNCGAKLPVFALLIAAFFEKNEAVVMFSITVISWIGALLSAKLLRTVIIRGESTPFVMELPPYRLPTFKGLLIHTWERAWQYIKKAGTVILGISVILWAMMTFPGLPESGRKKFDEKKLAILAAAPKGVSEEIAGRAGLSPRALELEKALARVEAERAEAGLQNSIAGRVGGAMEKVTRLAGFDWRTNIALLGGFAAKEVIVSTLGTAYSMGAEPPGDGGDGASLSRRLKNAPGWSPAVAFALILFTIFYAPCFVTVVCISQEAGSWKWGAFSMVFNTTLAFSLAVAAFQIGSLWMG